MAKRKKSQHQKTSRNSGQKSPRTGRNSGPDSLGGKIWLYGHHAVEAALANSRRKKYRYLITEENTESISAQNDLNIQPEIVSRQEIDQLLPEDAVHQGRALLVAPLPDLAIETICQNSQDPDIVIVLDQVTDPRNIGAIMRSATAFGASAIIMPDKHSPEEGAALAKAASGALDRLPMVRVTNLTRALGQLKDAGYWTVGLDASANQTLAEANLSGKLAVIMGAEGKGLRRLTAENCDFLVKIPIDPTADSLNVSAAAAITLYEIIRNRTVR